MQRVWNDASTLVTSRLTVVEAPAALTRALRAKRITTRGLAAAKVAVENLLANVDLVEIEPALAQHAGELAEQHALHAYDAVHLASALVLGDPEVVVATWDADLRSATTAEGLAIAA
jgi:predicted nucleic acid-binding protein